MPRRVLHTDACVFLSEIFVLKAFLSNIKVEIKIHEW